jgi:hypothetical protein
VHVLSKEPQALGLWEGFVQDTSLEARVHRQHIALSVRATYEWPCVVHNGSGF